MAERRRLGPPADPLEAAREELRKLRAADDWDEQTPTDRLTPVIHVHAFPPVERSRPLPLPSPAPPAPTPPLKSVAPRTTLELAGATVKRVPPWGIIIVIVVALLVYAYLALHGKAPAPP